MNRLRVEIKLVDADWQWLGKMTPEQLTALCEIADALSDMNDEE